MRIAIVNDMIMTVELLRRAVHKIPDCEVAWIAYDGAEALDKCIKDSPDLILMDIQMPVLNGVDATREIMRACPCPILIVTATVSGNSTEVFEALGEGALDAVNTPSEDLEEMESNSLGLINKIKILQKLSRNNLNSRFRNNDSPPKATAHEEEPLFVAIGASTGGPKAVLNLLDAIPRDINAIFALVQHIDEQFAAGFASWLEKSCNFKTKIAEAGEPLERGTIYIAGTNDHLIMGEDGRLRYDAYPVENLFRPSVDVFFSSLVNNWHGRGTAVLMTGIGEDGAAGLLQLKKAGWNTFAQNKKSCVVYGMPRKAVDIGAADEVLTPEDIGVKIYEMATRKNNMAGK